MQQIQDFSIRYSKPEDYEPIVFMASKFVKKIFPEEKVDFAKIRNLFSKSLENNTISCLVLVDKLDEPKGFILASISELYFHPKVVASCLAIWVEEEYRGHSKKLIKAFEKWAKYKNADFVSISAYEGVSPVKLDRLYQAYGYRLIEKMYWKDN